MFCNKCGNILPDHARFCTSCGAPVEGGTNVNTACAHSHGGQPLPQVGFVEAVRKYFTNFSDFSTRSRRSEYWWAMLFTSIVSVLLNRIFPDGSLISSLVSLVFLVPSIAVTVRRLHDVGKTGIFYLWNLLPLIGQLIIFLQVIKDSQPDNQWGPNPKYSIHEKDF